MRKVYIGIDNGVTGTIGMISDAGVYFTKTPAFKEQDYTKAKKLISRIDHNPLYQLLQSFTMAYDPQDTLVVMERPMVNPGRWDATKSALRALESTLIAIEKLGLPFRYIDSKEWQKALLPEGAEGKELKTFGVQIATRLFPKYKGKFEPDADGILIAQYAKSRGL